MNTLYTDRTEKQILMPWELVAVPKCYCGRRVLVQGDMGFCSMHGWHTDYNYTIEGGLTQ